MNLYPLAALIVSLSACGSTQPPASQSATADRPPASINAPFRDAELDVDRWTSRFEGESREVYRARTQIVDALSLRPGDAVADVGTGTGLFVKYLSEAVGSQGRVYALDIAPKFVEHVRKRARDAGLDNVAVSLSGNDDIQLPAESVDVVFVCDVYHHFENPPAILATIRRALKPGGRLVVVDYHRIEGKTRPFLMKHIRAPKEVFVREIQAAGFTALPSPPTPYLAENYLIVFRK